MDEKFPIDIGHPEESLSARNFFEDLKERVTSPFLSAFVISWLCANWKIFVGLFFYNSNDLARNNYNSYIGFISRNSSWWTMLIIPVCGALAYCFAYPYLQNYIKITHVRHRIRANNKILGETKEGKVPMTKYIELKEYYTRVTKSVEQLIAEQPLKAEENTKLKADIAVIRNENDKLKSDAELHTASNAMLSQNIQTWNYFNSINFLHGRWSITYPASATDPLSEKYQTLRVDIKGNSVYQDTNLVYIISKFSGNPTDATISFILESAPQSPLYHIKAYHLTWQPKENRLVGFENGMEQVVIIKRSGD